VLGGLKVDMRKPFFGANDTLLVGDFQALAGKSSVATFGATPVNNWYSAVLNVTGGTYINRSGSTQFRLSFARDDNDNNAADYMKFFSGNYANASAKPMLVIEYYVPANTHTPTPTPTRTLTSTSAPYFTFTFTFTSTPTSTTTPDFTPTPTRTAGTPTRTRTPTQNPD
jgi:hypothetical protein